MSYYPYLTLYLKKMRPNERKQAISLGIGADGKRGTSHEEFLNEVGESDGQAWAIRQLKEAIAAENSDDVSTAFVVAFSFGMTPGYLEPTLELATAKWHRSHENVVLLLDRLRRPESVDALQYLTNWVPEYLEYDDSRALARNAIWALSKIRTDEARHALQKISTTNDDGDLRALAAKRLVVFAQSS